MNYCFSLSQKNECHVKNDLFQKGKCCQQSVNILSVSGNDGMICHHLCLGMQVALMLSEVRPSDEAFTHLSN